MANLKEAPDWKGIALPEGARTYWTPAHKSNYNKGPIWVTRYRKKYKIVREGIVLHTPEEKADDNEVTPNWFANKDANASTHAYADNDGDLYQCVRENDFAWAQGTDSETLVRPYPKSYVPKRHGSTNVPYLSIEIEGMAENIEETFLVGGRQYQSVISLLELWCRRYNIPADRDHIVAHSEICTYKTDPGDGFPWDDLMIDLNSALKEEWPRTRPYIRSPRSSEVAPQAKISEVIAPTGDEAELIQRINDLEQKNELLVNALDAIRDDANRAANDSRLR